MTILKTEAEFLNYHGQCSWHSSDAVNGVLDVGSLDIEAAGWTKSHNVEINVTDPGVNTVNVHDFILRNWRIVNPGEHADGLRIKGAAVAPGPILNVCNVQYLAFQSGTYTLFCGEGYFREINVWNCRQTPGVDGAWQQQLIGSVKCPLVRVYTCTARTLIDTGQTGSIGAINVDATAVPGRFTVAKGPAPKVVPWTPPTIPPVTSPTPLPDDRDIVLAGKRYRIIDA
jgi:hypothetical protein